MNLEEISVRIKNPQLCGSSDIDELRQLSEKYPYAQVFSLLYLKALSINNDVRFDDELQHHAYRITDRFRLYELINEKGNNNSNIEIEENSSIELTNNELNLIQEEELVSPKIEEIEIVQPVELEQELIIEKIKIEENTLDVDLESNYIDDNQESFENENEQLINDDVSVDLHEEIHEIELYEIKSTDIEEDTIEIIEEKVSSIEEIIDKQSEDTSDKIEISIKPIEEHQIIQIKEEIEEIELENIEYGNVLAENDLEIEVLSHAISSNYSISNNKEVEIETEEEEIFEEKNEEIVFTPQFSNYSLEKESKTSSKKGFSSWLKANNNEVEREEIDSKDKKNSLVNQFIKDEPSISRPKKDEKEVEKPKAEFFSPVKKARRSLDENTLPVSETLAKIFAAQGNFPKAIYAYQQLIAINPEKKIFFANQITELTKKLNT